MDDDEITQLAWAARAGDRDAATSFIHATSAQLRGVLRHLAGSEQAEDLAQETYLRAFAALPRYAGDAPARLWLLSIARRVAADQVRSTQRRPRASRVTPDDGMAALSASPGPAGRVELQRAVAALDADRREAFVLTRVLGLSYAEAAEVCECAVGTIRSRVFRARADLLQALGEPGEQDSAGGDTALS